jgi:hypothetical protein
MFKEEAASCSFATSAWPIEEGELVKDDEDGCIEEAVGASDMELLATETVLALGSEPSACGVHEP